jgi:hypothetical protein
MNNTQSIELSSTGVRRMLNRYTPERAMAEYIWNGFDAKATIVHVDFEIDSSELDTIASVTISDNGNGICLDELQYKFKPILESQKRLSSDEGDLVRGKNGYGRLTFFKFATYAQWTTRYLHKNGKKYQYDIEISSDNLTKYTPSEQTEIQNAPGTSVRFTNIDTEISSKFIESKLKPFLRAEFAWFLELNASFQIVINGEVLDYQSIIEDRKAFPVNIQGIEFSCKYLRWNVKPNDEYSRFYFLNEAFDVRGTKTTLLNKKGDGFWHSIVVINNFFEDKIAECFNGKSISPSLFEDKDARGIFNDLISKLNDFLKKERRPFLRNQANKLLGNYYKDGVFPTFGDSIWEERRKEELEELVINLYEVEPRVFIKLNKEQQQIFLKLLNLIMDSNERGSLFKIIGEVVDLEPTDRDEFAKLLTTSRLKHIISTIKLIQDRILVIEDLKKLVFKHELEAGEVKNLQKFIENHYWIFGEEYRMICAEEVKFEEALNKYIYYLRGVSEKKFIQHPDKYKEMDLFLAGKEYRDGGPHNLVIEIKNPTTIKKLTNKEYGQIEKYMDVILKQDCFNDNREQWDFYLIGQDYDDIVARKVAKKETGLCSEGENYKLYVKKWSQIINDIERRHKYLLEKLKTERQELSKAQTLEDVMTEMANNSAIVQKQK